MTDDEFQVFNAALAECRQTDRTLRWPESIASYAGTNIGIPVVDEAGADVGEMLIPIAEAAVLRDMLNGVLDGDDDADDALDAAMATAAAALLHTIENDPQTQQQKAALIARLGTPPRPVKDPPTRVDACSSDIYDQMRARLAWLEQNHRDTVSSEQGKALLNATVRLGERDAAIARVRDLADRMRTWASPDFGRLAAHYADSILEALDGPSTQEPS